MYTLVSSGHMLAFSSSNGKKHIYTSIYLQSKKGDYKYRHDKDFHESILFSANILTRNPDFKGSRKLVNAHASKLSWVTPSKPKFCMTSKPYQHLYSIPHFSFSPTVGTSIRGKILELRRTLQSFKRKEAICGSFAWKLESEIYFQWYGVAFFLVFSHL